MDEERITEKGYVPVNVVEELVKSKVRELMATYDMCRCEKCYWDTCAIILNQLKPHYFTTEKGLLLSMLSATDYQFKTDLAVTVLKALKIVKDSPRH